jgi:thymidylate synthase (FAD)
METHVQLNPAWPTEPIASKQQVLDGITGFVEYWDFSLANTSYESRVYFISKVASICYQSPKSLGSISLFNRLQAESAGLPSSSYEMCPVLLTNKQFQAGNFKQCWKFGEQLDSNYLLTNLRALIEDVGEAESLNYLNTDPAELQIIRDNFKVFLFNVDLSTRAQMVRHRINWQELSRRYVSGAKSPFSFYVSSKLSNIVSRFTLTNADNHSFSLDYTTQNLIDACVNHYNAAIDSGVKPEEARRILPQAMMTQIWGAFQPKQLESYFKLRLDSHAQREIRMVSEAMQELINA